MITFEEIKTLRSRGEKDDEILKQYQGYDQDTATDIEALLKRGEKPSQILDGLAAFYAGNGDSKAEPRPDPMADKSTLEKAKGLAQFGGANLARGLAKTAKAAGWKGTGDSLESVAKSIEPAPGAYDPAGPRFDWSDPSTYGYAPRAVLEGAPGVAADLTAGALGTAVGGPVGGIAGFMGMNAARNFGGNLEARMEHQAPGSEPSTGDYLAAGASTAAEAALSRVGMNPALSSVSKGAGLKAMAQIPGLIAKATGAEAAAGAAGDVVNQVGRTAGTRDGLSVDPKEIGNVAALSGLTGGAIRTARGVSDVTNAGRFAGINEDAAARAVARMDATKVKADNAETAFKRVEMARKTADVELDDAHQIVKPLLKSKGNATSTDETRTMVKGALTQLKANDEVNPEHLSSLRHRLGDTQEGTRLLDLMDERNALNQLSSKGRYDERAGTFAGGLATNPVVDTILNPRRYLGAKMIGGAGALGAAELPAFAQASLLGPALVKIAAAQAGAYGATRTLDKVTGLRNPAKEFSDRFRGLQKLSGDDLPSFRQEAADAQAQKDRVTALGARSKQEDQAWRAKDAQDRAQALQEARQASEAEKAWATREAAPGAREAQEEAMWRQAETQRAQETQDDATAQAGIHAGYSELLKQAILAGQASKKLREGQEATQQRQVDAAWATKAQQDTQEARQAATATRDYGRAEAQRSQRTPEAIKAAQEEAMWQAQGAPGGSSDWTENDAVQAIQKVISARQKASEFIVGQSRKATETPTEPEGIPEALKVRVRAKAKADQATTQEPEAINPETIRITHGDQVVERPKASIRNPEAYVAKTRSRMEARQSFVDDILSETGKPGKQIMDVMLTKLNSVARSWEDAHSIIEDYINELPEKHWGKGLGCLQRA